MKCRNAHPSWLQENAQDLFLTETPSLHCRGHKAHAEITGYLIMCIPVMAARALKRLACP
eukprot:1033713-Pelagomonas_calceolata.AAC.1